MKKHLFLIGVYMFVPKITLADITQSAIIWKGCSATNLSSVESELCNTPTNNCSSGSDLISGYACGAMKLRNNTQTTPVLAILCVPDNASITYRCYYFSNKMYSSGTSDKCRDGYNLKSVFVTPSGSASISSGQLSQRSATINVTKTMECCNSCSGWTWEAYPSNSAGQQGGQNYCSNAGVCTHNTGTYRCAPGYYNTAGVSQAIQYAMINNCTSCATATGNSNATSIAGASAITDCYVPSGTTGTDSTGSFIYTNDCHYSN